MHHRTLLLLFLSLLLPAAGFAAGFDLNAFLRDKLRSGEDPIVLPPGELRLDRTVVLDRAFHDRTITGRGRTRLVMTRLTETFFLTGCRNLTLDGFTIDYDPLPFTQGVITAVDGKRISFTIDAGYPDLTAPYLVKHPLFFDRDTLNWKWATPSNHAAAIQALDPRRGVVTMVNPPDRLVPGDRLCLNYRNTTVFKLRHQAADVTFSNLVIESGPGAAFIARRTAGLHRFLRVAIRRGPLPPGADVPRLISTGADGVNYGTARRGPVIEDCDFSFMGDDSVNFHGVVLPVIKRTGNEFITAMGFRPDDLGKVVRPGDTARILAPGNYRVTATAAVEKIEPLAGVEEAGPEIISAFFQGQKMTATGIPNYILYRVRLRGAVPEAGQCVDFPAVNCPGFVIRNSRFHDHRARGLRLMADRGEVTGCRFSNLEQSAITVGPEYDFWREGGWVDTVRICGNVAEKVCQGNVSWSSSSYFPGAIAVIARLSGTRDPVWPGNTGITITGNTVRDCPVSGVFVFAADGVTVTDNVFSRVNQVRAGNTGSRCGIRFQPRPVAVDHSGTVTVSGNRN